MWAFEIYVPLPSHILNEIMQKKILLIDAMGLIFRAYYAMIKSPRFTTKGLNTSAMRGLLALQHLVKRVRETEHRGGVKTFRGEPRTFNHGVIGSENQAHGIYQEDFFLHNLVQNMGRQRYIKFKCLQFPMNFSASAQDWEILCTFAA